MHALEQKTKEYIDEKQLIGKGERVLLALSGGADSVALFWLLRALEIDFSALHINHGLRDAAAQDEAFVRALCAEEGILLRVERRDVAAIAKAEKCGLEEAGRDVRRTLLAEEAARAGAAKIALAHHADDVAETVLMHLIRGTGPAGIASMQAAAGKFIRPLLFARHAELLAYLEETGRAWREDESNQSRAYLRNRIRLDVLPYLTEHGNARAVEHLAAFAERMAKQEALLRSLSGKEAVSDPAGRVLLLSALKDLPADLRFWHLRQFLSAATCGRYTEAHLKALSDLVSAEAGKEVHLPNALTARRGYDAIILEDREKEKKNGAEEVPLAIPGTTLFGGFRFRAELSGHAESGMPAECLDHAGFCASAEGARAYTFHYDYDKIKESICVRYRRPGDFIVIHENGQKKSLSDELTDRKMDRALRDALPLLCAGREVLLIPGERDGASARLDRETKTVLSISCERESEDV